MKSAWERTSSSGPPRRRSRAFLPPPYAPMRIRSPAGPPTGLFSCVRSEMGKHPDGDSSAPAWDVPAAPKRVTLDSRGLVPAATEAASPRWGKARGPASVPDGTTRGAFSRDSMPEPTAEAVSNAMKSPGFSVFGTEAWNGRRRRLQPIWRTGGPGREGTRLWGHPSPGDAAFPVRTIVLRIAPKAPPNLGTDVPDAAFRELHGGASRQRGKKKPAFQWKTGFVLRARIELARLAAPPPQDGVSTSSTI